MGTAIIWIMLMHGLELFPRALKGVPMIRFIIDRGMIGVEMFLLMSGIGLFFSLFKNENLLQFYTKRINRVVIPYLVIAFPFWIWKDICLEKNVGRFFLDISLLSFWKEGVYTVWYIALILPIYAVYPFIFRVFMKETTVLKKGIFIALGFALPFLVYVINPYYFGLTEIAFWRISSFILGNLLAERVMINHKINKIQFFVMGSITAGFIAIAFILNYMMRFPGVVRLIYLPLGLGCSLSIGGILKFLNVGQLNRFLGTMGKYSLELYLIHIFLRSVYKHYVPKSVNSSSFQGILIWFMIMCLSVLLSILLHKSLSKLGVLKSKCIYMSAMTK
ncbi:acyltransferase family protein [Faecalicatena contorta]|nr:acyltransferase [Faecalicatena contorta]